MAVVRPARSSPPYALIIFVFLWVIATALAIFFYVTWDKANVETEQAKAEVLKLVRQNDRGDAEIKEWLAGSNGTAIERAKADVDSLKQIIGDQNASVFDLSHAPANGDQGGLLEQKLAQVGQPGGTTVLQALDALRKEADAAKAAEQQWKDQLAAGEKDYTSTKDNFAAQIDSFNKTIAADKDEVDKLTAQIADLSKDAEGKEADYQQKVSKIQKDYDDDRTKWVLQMQTVQEQLADANTVVKQLRDQIGDLRGQGVASTKPIERIADGTIVQTTLDDNNVFINLGRRDHVTPGLTFAVYDPKEGLPSGPNGGGKGAIEVTDVGESQSLCRITHIEPKQHFLEGDQIANPVYSRDRSRKLHFVISGDFDLDGDGIATAAERDKLVRLIQSWGGVIDDTVTTQTDYLVTGTPPASAMNKFDTDTPQTNDENKTRQQEQNTYGKMIDDAKSFSIPILDANRFLAMIGYYNTTVLQ